MIAPTPAKLSRLTVALAVVAPVCCCGAALAGDVLGWDPLVASLGAVMVVGVLGWLHRGADVVDVFVHGMIVGYVAFLGLALARTANPIVFNQDDAMWFGTPVHPTAPVLLLVGIAYALLLTVAVAIPLSRLPVRHRPASAPDERFLAFIDERDRSQRVIKLGASIRSRGDRGTT
ncbi:MAG TPA: hypothetical protein VHT05_12075 [Candidatus Elarobacter sp.]|jgi:hypothetical protein|nr:hypothetical protein [Candidatus Elarobacter sp.]